MKQTNPTINAFFIRFQGVIKRKSVYELRVLHQDMLEYRTKASSVPQELENLINSIDRKLKEIGDN